MTTSTNSTIDAMSESSALPGFLNLLPIGVECSKGAIVMGNQNTRSILTAKFDNAAGKIDAKQSRPVDQYKQVFDFDFGHPVIEFKHNKDYIESQISTGAKLHSLNDEGRNKKRSWISPSGYRDRLRYVRSVLDNLAPYRRSSVESFTHPRPKSSGTHDLTDDSAGAYGQNRWLGLTRYLDDDDDLIEQERWKAVEYGQFSNIVDSPAISMSFYWDVPGRVPDPIKHDRKIEPGFEVDINGDAPPDWGIEIKIGGGTIHYGPWADRQRADIQSVFFPTLYKDAFPATKISPGQYRVNTVMKIVIEIEEQTTLRIPTREDSKDWKWRGQQIQSATTGAKGKKIKHGKGNKRKHLTQTPETRPSGWLDVKVMPDSTVSFTMDLVASNNGYNNRVDLDLKGLEIASSVNHGLLWRSTSQTISCKLSNPLGWNTLRKWHIDIHDNDLELFILRDHMFLITDLINDWTSGPPADFHTFVPFEYSLGLTFTKFKLYLNANDSNIINNPSDFDDNTFIVLWGESLRADLTIPIKTFLPARNRVCFDVEAHEGGLELRTPSRNTQHTFLNSSNVASLKDLKVNGSYNFYTTTSPNLTDILLMNVYGFSLRVDLHGFLIRYFMKIKDNYFGDDIHFRTLEEYQDQVDRMNGQDAADVTPAQHSRLSNDLDVILSIKAEKLIALIPAHLYSSDENTRLEIYSATSDLRITNYYMDLAVSLSPIRLTYTHRPVNRAPDLDDYSNTQMFIDGVEVSGHRLFGLPPTEPTYVCNWDFDVGCVRGECSIDFLRCLTMSIRCFGLTFDDDENALPPLNPPLIHDVTFLRARLRPIILGLQVEETVFLLTTNEANIDFNDWADPLFSDRSHVVIPNIALALADSHGKSTKSNVHKAANVHAYLQTTVELHAVKRKQDFQSDRQLQQRHLVTHDSRTHRVPWLVHNQGPLSASAIPARPPKTKAPVMPFPPMPEPVSTANDRTQDETSSRSSGGNLGSSRSVISRKSSFLINTTASQHKSNRSISSHRKGESHQKLSKDLKDEQGLKRSTSESPSQKPFPNSSRLPPLGNDPTEEFSAPKTESCHPGLSFSSPYKKPYFPILGMHPNVEDVPHVPENLDSDTLMTDLDTLEALRADVLNQDAEQTSFMLSFHQGVQVYCTPRALFLVNQLLAALQTNNTVTQLDSLQIDTIKAVLGAKDNAKRESRGTALRIFAPWVAARFVNKNQSRLLGLTRQERYDVVLDNLIATATSFKGISAASEMPENTSLAFHLALNHLTFSARESVADQTHDQAIVSLSLIEPVFWMSQSTALAAEIQLKKLAITSASRKIDYISSLIRQTLVLLEELTRGFAELEKKRMSRNKLLVLLLVTEGMNTPDPPFLTRVSYVIRNAPHHLRTSDSWKMMSRLRYIYQCLPEHSRERILAQCAHKLASCPHDAGKRVLASFDHWGTVDSAQVRSSFLMRAIYGETSEQPVRRKGASMPSRARLRIGELQILVEPGTEQNEIAVKGLIVSLALNQAASLNDAASVHLASLLHSSIEVHCTELAIRLNWTLLGLIENVIDTIRAATTSISKDKKGLHQKNEPPSPHCLHIVISIQMSILKCDTPNLRVISLCQALKCSLVTVQEVHATKTSSMSIMFNADAATSEVKRHSALLTLYKLIQPRVFGSKTGILAPWNFVGTGQDVLFQVLANPLQLIEAADCFLEHEVAHIIHWMKSLQSLPSPGRPSVAKRNSTDLPKFQVVLSLDSYLLSLGILPSLTYQISGSQARTSIKCGLDGQHKLKVDFGLEEHSHTFKTKQSQQNHTNVLSNLQMPPINGRVDLDLGPGQKIVDLHTLIETVIFDASAVHSIFTAINRPEMIRLGNSIKHEKEVFQAHYKAIFEVHETYDSTEANTLVLYKANVTLSSLVIRARTSDSLTVTQGAKLQFKLDHMQLKARNSDLGLGHATRFPELEVQFRGISLNLLRYHNLDLLPCGDLNVEVILRCTSKTNDAGDLVRAYQLRSSSLQIDVYAETAPVAVAILVHLQDTLKTFDLAQEVQSLRKLGRVRLPSEAGIMHPRTPNQEEQDNEVGALFSAMYSLEMTNICVVWRIEKSTSVSPGREPENLILSFTKIDLATRKDNAARLLIQNFQLQMVRASKTSTGRSHNSALLPEVVFNVAYVSTRQDRRLAFQAVGKALDLQLTSQFILPASDLRRSIAFSIQQVRTATADWNASTTVTEGQTKRLLGNKKLASLLVDADFAGAVVYIQSRSVKDPQSLAVNVLRGGRVPQHGRYNQFTPENASNSSTTLRAPGIAFKVEYKNTASGEQSLNAELKVDASTNVLYPTVVPLILEISSSVKDIVGGAGEQKKDTRSSISQPRFLEDDRIRGADPSAIFGDCKLNLGLRICKQEFSLSCQPIARVTATARFEDIYITINTVQSQAHGKFFTVSGTFTSLQASVQHVYSRESTGSFEIESVVVSFMNSRHVSTANGISAILNISPMKAQINGKQSQDFLLFREIWVPPEIRGASPATVSVPASESQAFIVQRYQQIAAAGAFPWNATVSIAELDVQVDLGQSLGKSAFIVSDFWISSKKSSNWEQNLCLGFNKMAVNSTGRMSGFVELQDLKVRTSIQWPMKEASQGQTPLVQASLAFDHLRVKAAFDYQAFAIADINTFEFMMYNVRDLENIGRDRLVGVLEGNKVQVFSTTTTASQAVGLFQAFQRLYQEKVAAYETSLRDIEKFLRRKSTINPTVMRVATERQADPGEETIKSPLKLQTDVVVTLKAVNIGAFPNTFLDNQILKLEALDASARFAVVLENDRIHSTLGMTLGQLRIALSGITRASVPKTLGEVSVAEVVTSATGSRGGTILKVPKLIATMETWQNPESTQIDYIFKSSFQGKVDVGWNYSRISYIRGMWTNHTRALAQRLGKPLSQSAVHITGGPRPEGDEGGQTYDEGEGGKITAVVNVPQSKYQYTALQPAVIETPQLRDMGEATPPLEWIGLHRDRLPNLTHQIVIVTLLEVAKEVDDAYSRILGSS